MPSLLRGVRQDSGEPQLGRLVARPVWRLVARAVLLKKPAPADADRYDAKIRSPPGYAMLLPGDLAEGLPRRHRDNRAESREGLKGA